MIRQEVVHRLAGVVRQRKPLDDDINARVLSSFYLSFLSYVPIAPCYKSLQRKVETKSSKSEGKRFIPHRLCGLFRVVKFHHCVTSLGGCLPEIIGASSYVIVDTGVFRQETGDGAVCDDPGSRLLEYPLRDCVADNLSDIALAQAGRCSHLRECCFTPDRQTSSQPKTRYGLLRKEGIMLRPSLLVNRVPCFVLSSKTLGIDVR